MAYDPLYDPPEDVEGDAMLHWEECICDSMIEMVGGKDEANEILNTLYYDENNDMVREYVRRAYKRYVDNANEP